MDFVKIEEITFLQDYKMEILLSDKHRIIYDMEPKLITARFRDLAETDIFADGKIIKGRLIQWNANTELTVEEILEAQNNPCKHA